MSETSIRSTADYRTLMQKVEEVVDRIEGGTAGGPQHPRGRQSDHLLGAMSSGSTAGGSAQPLVFVAAALIDTGEEHYRALIRARGEALEPLASCPEVHRPRRLPPPRS